MLITLLYDTDREITVGEIISNYKSVYYEDFL